MLDNPAVTTLRNAVLGTLVLASLAACADDPPPCDPLASECALEDFDGDGVPNGDDAFPEDGACHTRSDDDCSACGQGCEDRETCGDDGVCICKAIYGGDGCLGCADPHFEAPDCNVCAPAWVGPACDYCANDHLEAPGCTECLPLFSGDQCEGCADPHRAAPACTGCLPAFQGEDCTECASYKYTGPECDVCADVRFTGPDCDQCADETFTGPDCDVCADPTFTGPECDQCADPKFTGTGCEKCAVSASSPPDCNPYPEAPESFYQVHLPQVVLGDDGESDDLYVDLPEGTTSVFVTVASELDYVFLTLKKVITPAPFFEHVVKGAGDGACFYCSNRVSAGQKLASFLIPNDPDIGVGGGEWTFKIRATGILKIDGMPIQYPPESGLCDVVILARTDPVPDAGVLRVHLHFTGSDGLTAQGAPTDGRIQQGIDDLSAVMAAAGIGIDVAGYHDVPGVAEDDTLVHLQSTLGWPNDLSKLLLTGQGDDVAALNIFFVGSIYQDYDFGGGGVVLGIAAGVPGPAFVGPSYRSGVAIATFELGARQDFFGNVLAHEIGHYLGLYHSTEKDGGTDTLDDTADDDGTNLMYWAYSPEQQQITQGQGFVMRSHPLVLGDQP